MTELDRMDREEFQIAVEEAYGHDGWFTMWTQLNDRMLMEWDDLDKAIAPEVREECRRRMLETVRKLNFMKSYAEKRGGIVPELRVMSD